MSEIVVIQKARGVPVDAKLLREITRSLLKDRLSLESFELGVHLVGAQEMARVNETFLNHEGPTDVITFDHSEPGTPNSKLKTLHGELYVCQTVAVSQAKEFRTRWPNEVVRYVVHGVLHLLGYDDHSPADRRQMKREENRLVRELEQRFPISKLAQRPPSAKLHA
ncbi:MAG: rRNA maturation RNase YbeY [Verrucomicrobiota bacterium]